MISLKIISSETENVVQKLFCGDNVVNNYYIRARGL